MSTFKGYGLTVLHHMCSTQHCCSMPLHDMQQMEFPHTALMQPNSTTETTSVAFQLCARCGTTLCNSSPSALVSLGLLCTSALGQNRVPPAPPCKNQRYTTLHSPWTVQNPSSRCHGSRTPPNHSVAHTAAIKELLAPKNITNAVLW